MNSTLTVAVLFMCSIMIALYAVVWTDAVWKFDPDPLLKVDEPPNM